LVAAGTLAGVLLFECLLRATGISHPVFFQSDEDLGLRLRPGAEGWYTNEGEAYVRINSHGFRDREHSKAKPKSTFRIAVLGDSYAEARQVPMEDTFWAFLERDLGSCRALAGREVEVMNFGAGGYGTAQELITLRQRVWPYSPDIVILAFFSGNDVRDNFRGLGTDPRRPFFVYKNGRLEPDMSFRNLAVHRASLTRLARLGVLLTEYSRVLQLLYKVKNQGIGAMLRRQNPEKLPGEDFDVGLDNLVLLKPTDPLWEEGWRVTEGLILLMRDEVVQKGADFLVVTLSIGIQVHPDRAVRTRFMQRLGISDLFYPDRRIQDLGAREGVSVLNLARNFQSYAEQHEAFLHGFGKDRGWGHWNQEGHRLAGKMIAQKLCQDITTKR
jgi:hypothetical protein